MMDMDTFTAGWSKRLKAEKDRKCRRMHEAIIAVYKCARILYEKYGVSRVYLIGSLATPEDFHERSDIDLVVEGLTPRLYFKALAELWRELPAGLELDLIPFEDIDSEFRERVLKNWVAING